MTTMGHRAGGRRPGGLGGRALAPGGGGGSTNMSGVLPGGGPGDAAAPQRV